MIEIKNTTLLVVDCFNYHAAISSINKSISKAKFDKALFITDIDIYAGECVDTIKINTLKSKDEYSHFLLKEAWKYIQTDFVLVSQHDSWILNEKCFDERLYDVDYAGALWLETDGLANGNGGMSWRSKKLMEIVGKDDFINTTMPEDVSICRVYRRYLEKNYGLIWASDEICEKFSFELREPTSPTFAFHSFFHTPFKEHILLKRTAALGDLIMLEPIISFYSENGYQVVIDTIPEFMQIFSRYRHKVIHISSMNKKIIPQRSINFDMAYENNPQKPVIESYIELTGEKIEIRNSKLDFPVADNAFVFKKYILIHIDDTGMEHRNQHSINWSFVVPYYLRLGYQVFQIGKRMKEEIAPYMNTPNIESLMFMIKGADLVVGIDSSPTQIAVALGIPTVIFFGSVNPKLRYNNFDKIEVIHTDCPSGKETFCYHDEVGTTGSICKFDKEKPPCTVYSEYAVIKSINKLLN